VSDAAIEAVVRRILAEEGERGGAAPVSDAQIEQAVERVLGTMTDATVRRVVTEIAEQLVREEIEKINQTPE
jgi:hypothetical protein